MAARARVALLLLALCVLLTPALRAQSQATTGVIEGTVLDESGAVLPGVQVTLVNTATNFEKVLITDDRGRFRGVLMPLGPYKVTASLEGFSTLVRDGIQLTLGATVSLSLTLQVSAVGGEILVTAEAPLIEVSRTEGQIRIDERSIEGLPNDGRNFLEFSKLTPGVAIVQGPDGDELTISGQRGINNNVSVDGADFNNPFFGEQRGGQRPPFTFNLDAIQEVLVVTDGAPAEFGRSSGGFVNVVTKSGTNNLNGTAHVFVKNDSLSGDPKTRTGTVPGITFDQSQLGFTLGGPIRSDKAFFFVAGDTQEKDETKQTNAGRMTPRLINFLNGVGIPDDNSPIDRTDDADAYLAKLDWQPSQKHLFTSRWAYSYSQQVNGTFDVDTWGKSANGIETDYAHSLASSLISTLSGTLLNEARVQFSKEWRPRPYDGPRIPGTNNPFPDTAILETGERFGMPFFLPIEYDDDRIQINNNISVLKGKHTIKAGVEYNEVASSQTFIGFAGGRYIFDSVDGFISFAQNPNTKTCSDGSIVPDGICPVGTSVTGPVLLYLQLVGVGGRSVQEVGTQTITQKEPAIFIQDQWQPKSNLTVEFGVRWEEQDQPGPRTPPNEVFFAPFIGQTVTNEFGTFEFPSDGTIPDDDSIQPRLGISWAPNAKSVFRFNSGLYMARLPALMLASTRSTNGSIGQNVARLSFIEFILGPVPAWPTIIPQSEFPDLLFFPEIFVFDKNFELPKTWTSAVSWERELSTDYSLLLKVNYAKTDHLFRMFNPNDPVLGCPWGSGLPPGGVNGIFCGGPSDASGLHVVQSSARSRYWGYTIGINKRWSNKYQFQIYYTNSEDKSDDDNERDPFSYRYARADSLDAEYSYSDRHQRNRVNAWLSWEAPGGVNVNVRFSYRDPQPQNITATGEPAGFPEARINPDGSVTRRNLGEKDNRVNLWDLRLSKDFQVGNITVQPIVDIFNVFDEENFFRPEVTNLAFNFDGTVRSGAGDPREIQLGVRVVW